MRKVKKIACLTLMTAFCWISESACGEELSKLPWHLLPRATALTESQKVLLLEVISNEECYGKCSGTILDCLKRNRPDKAAVRLTNFGSYVLSLGASQQDLVEILKERAKFGKGRNTAVFSYEETPTFGNPRATITITEFAEFKCLYCADLAPVLKKVVEESKGKVCLFFKHFPLKKHPESVLTSRAVQAAHRQGKFWEMYELLYQDVRRQSMEELWRYAAQLGLDMQRFKQDLEDVKVLHIVERDKIEGVRAKVPGTPTLFINGKLFDLRYHESFLKDVINEEAERLGVEPPYQEWVYDAK